MAEPASGSPEIADPPGPALWRRSMALGLVWYALSSAVVVATVLACWQRVEPELTRNHATAYATIALQSHPLAAAACTSYFVKAPPREWYTFFVRFDGVPYTFICRQGYDYKPDAPSMLGYLPGYSFLGRAFLWLPGMNESLALLLVAHLCLAGCFVLLAAYVMVRCPDADPNLPVVVLIVFGFLPITFCYRLVLTESFFLLVVLLVFFGMERRWPVALLAVLIGLATAIRPVGIALIPPLWLYLWRLEPNRRRFMILAALWTPVCVWGLASFVAYCALAFGEPLVYTRIQAQFVARELECLPKDNKFLALLTLRPFWANFTPGTHCYWRNFIADQDPLFALQLANPVWFGAGILLTIGGAWKRLVNGSEALLAAGMFGIPYISVSYELCMGSHARYTATVFPIYLILGQLALRLHPRVFFVLVLASALLLVNYTGRFVLVYPFSF